MNEKRENILGVGVNPINMDQALACIEDWVESDERNYVCVTPVHSIMDCVNDEATRRVFNQSGLTTPDGMPVVWLLKLKGYQHVGRVYGPELLNAVCEAFLKKDYRHYFYGGSPYVTEKLVQRIKERYPRISVAGYHSPPFRELSLQEQESLINEINASEPHFLWVSLGAPRQEHWMAEHIGKINAPVMIGVGAAFDFISGHKKQAPQWLRRSGMEWMFRFLQEPKRLWPRYRRYPKFVFLLTLQLLGLRKFPINTDK